MKGTDNVKILQGKRTWMGFGCLNDQSLICYHCHTGLKASNGLTASDSFRDSHDLKISLSS